jgi:hypothetical protein
MIKQQFSIMLPKNLVAERFRGALCSAAIKGRRAGPFFDCKKKNDHGKIRMQSSRGADQGEVKSGQKWLPILQ